MDFGTTLWMLYVSMALLIKLPEAAITSPSRFIKASPGETVNFKWTSNEAILDATWGIRSGSDDHLADPQFIFVRSPYETPVINPELDADRKSRVHYTGDLTAGHAWFALSNVKVNDSNIYICNIREKSSSTTSYYSNLTVHVYVEPLTTAPSTTKSQGTNVSGPANTTAPSNIKSQSTNTSGLSKGVIAGIAIAATIIHVAIAI